MTREANEKELLEDAVDAFRKATGLDALMEEGRLHADAQLRILKGNKHWRFDVEVKPFRFYSAFSHASRASTPLRTLKRSNSGGLPPSFQVNLPLDFAYSHLYVSTSET